MSAEPETFRIAFLNLLRALQEATGTGVGVISTPAEDGEWWASWNIDISGKTYVLSLAPLDLEASWNRRPTPKPN